ncbi:MAG: glycosyltransferase family 4 protein [Ferruginibacter sp.]|nr:glycosyltransferase family 4 protein [Ferruginibacter sp.]
MNIGFDGKRIFQNKTGLGNYGRTLVTILAQLFPQNRYILFAPKQTGLFMTGVISDAEVHVPKSLFYKAFPVLWRRHGMIKDIAIAGLNIYHGLSNELPRGIEIAKIKTVVTVHDLIFERFPETYHFDERFVHRWKVKRACKIADAIIAISKQTKDDLVNLYGINAEKIFICYQSCNPVFEKKTTEVEKELVRKKYQLPDKYFLFVSSITSRKNLFTICKAMILLKDELAVPLVVIGDGKKEKEKVKQLMKLNGIEERLILLNELPSSKESSFTSGSDFPAIYQQALALVYPSIFEGFGLPVLEALWSGLPVICSNTSSLPEVAGDAALYFSPYDCKLLAKHMADIATNTILVETLSRRGFEQAGKFATGKYADSIVEVYKGVMVGDG